jgi:hypothetical protein
MIAAQSNRRMAKRAREELKLDLLVRAANHEGTARKIMLEAANDRNRRERHCAIRSYRLKETRP